MNRCLLALTCSCLLACAGPGSRTPPKTAPSASAAPTVATLEAIDIPLQPALALLPRRVVASDLANPRGMLLLADGDLLVSEAGTGTPDRADGRLLRLSDRNHDGDFLGAEERRVILDGQPSKNILDVVRRDEVFGMAGMAEGDGRVLVALAFFGGPSTLFEVAGDRVTPWSTTHGNINDVSYDPKRKAWFGVSSTSDEVVQLLPGRGSERVIKVPPLPSGQDPVPAYLGYDPITGDELVTLFSGSPEGEEGGSGVELVPRAGGIIGVAPATKSFRWVVHGLTVPTDLAVAPDGTIFVLEFCDAFLDPVPSREALAQGPSHGGFKRFSGRLLRVDRARREVAIVAQGLDAPTNLTFGKETLYVAEGMGTPGREIPGPTGTQKLVGFIERIELGRGTGLANTTD